MADYNHAYLIGCLLLFPIWIFILLCRKDLLRKMLNMGAFGGMLSVVFARPFLHDYWHPDYTLHIWHFGGIEDFLYGFFAISIASVIYEVLLKKKAIRLKDNYKKLWLPVLIGYTLFFYLLIFIGFPSIYSALLSFLVLTFPILMIRKDLIKVSIISGLIMFCLALIGFSLFLKIYPNVITMFWYKQGINSYLLFDIPLGELIWSFGLGMTMGPAYDFFAGQKFRLD
jgi:hypothetical protein